MLKAHIENNEVIATGEVLEGDNYSGFCCEGHSWKVVIVAVQVWGMCQSTECPVCKTSDVWHQGVSSIDQSELQLWLAEKGEEEKV